MPKKYIAILVIVVFIAIVVMAGLNFITQDSDSGKSKVAATIFPIYDITRNIVSDKIDVDLVLPSGASPHTFEFTPKKLKELQNTETIFTIGHGLDNWINNIENSIGDVKILTVDEGIQLRQSVEVFSDEPEEGEDGSIDPHYWPTLTNAKIIARNIASEIIALDSENKDFYESNLDNYIQKLEEKDKEFKDKLDGIENKNTVTLHDAWYYFAEEYGINILGTFEPAAGREPTPQYLARLKKTIEENNVRVVFSEPQISTSNLEPFTKDMGLEIFVLDPLGADIVGRDSYLGMMEYNIDTIIKALK